MYKRFALWLLVASFLIVGTTGFVRLESKFNVNQDGTMDIEAKMMVYKLLRKNLEIVKEGLKKQNSNIVFENNAAYSSL